MKATITIELELGDSAQLKLATTYVIYRLLEWNLQLAKLSRPIMMRGHYNTVVETENGHIIEGDSL